MNMRRYAGKKPLSERKKWDDRPEEFDEFNVDDTLGPRGDSSVSLVPPRLLFRFCVPCRYTPLRWSGKEFQLGPEFRLPDLHSLDSPRPSWADFHFAWNERGLYFAVEVADKGLPKNRRIAAVGLKGFEALELWIDTRDTRESQKPSRFCHLFCFALPSGKNTGRLHSERFPLSPGGGFLETPGPKSLAALFQSQESGYCICGFIGTEAMTGFAPTEFPRIGFHYRICDLIRGRQTFGPGDPLPHKYNPSLWVALELIPPEETK